MIEAQLDDVKAVLFLGSSQPKIDRGWQPEDAQKALIALGIDVGEENIESMDELRELLARLERVVVWPVCYTIGPDVNGPLVAEQLENCGVPFVGVSASKLRLSSKLAFKDALIAKSLFPTPSYIEITIPWKGEVQGISYPAMLKTEFSCNSEGVVLLRDEAELRAASVELHERFGQRLYVESWERRCEYTVAFMPAVGSDAPCVAALELALADGRPFIDSEAKSNNALLRFSRPAPRIATTLESTTLGIAKALEIDGHFRLDFVENDDKSLFALEANFLPCLTRTAPAQSYFPMAFGLSGKCTYEKIVERALRHALERARKTRGSSDD